MVEKMTRLDRAKQFAPFNALRGYYEEIKKEEFIPDEKRELTEEQITYLDNFVANLKKGDVVKVIHYIKGGYKTTVGAISQIDLTLKYITVIKDKIIFSDVFNIEKV